MQWDVPFSNLTAGPELRECFVTCKLPQQGLKLDEVALENSDVEILATWPVEVTCSCQTHLLSLHPFAACIPHGMASVPRRLWAV